MRLFSLASLGVIVLALIYGAWQMGRAFEAAQPVDFMICRPAADPEFMDCVNISMPARDARTFHEELMRGEVPRDAKPPEPRPVRREGA